MTRVNTSTGLGDLDITTEPQMASLEQNENYDQPEQDLYFYHSDHLGSSSFITDATGNAIQHLQYLPYGESFVDQRLSNWNTPYTFSGKEKDEETGYSYFGARYYDSELSVWLSVDPLSDMYPSTSPFMYVAGNPIKLVDPDGMRITGGGENGIDPSLREDNNTAQSNPNTYNGNGSFQYTEPSTNTNQENMQQNTPKKLPAFSILESNYPKYGYQYPNNGVSNEEFAKQAGGKVQSNIESGVFSNTCALRVSHSLTESGEDLPFVPGSGNSSSNKDKKWYYPKVAVLSKQLTEIYGAPQVNNTSNLSDLQGKKGIIIFYTPGLYSDASGHATLWDGTQALGGFHDYIPLLGNGVTASLWVTP